MVPLSQVHVLFCKFAQRVCMAAALASTTVKNTLKLGSFSEIFSTALNAPKQQKSQIDLSVYSTWDIHYTYNFAVQACNLTIVNMKSIIMLPSPYLTPCGHWLPRNIQRAHYTKNNNTFQHVCCYLCIFEQK